jgi:hypothetical protein
MLKAGEFVAQVADLTLNALFVEREQVYFPGAVEECLRLSKSRVAFRIVVTELSRTGFNPLGVNVDFHGLDALKPPMAVGDIVSDLNFGGIIGPEVGHERRVKCGVGFAILVGEKGSLAGESVALTVQPCAGFGFIGFGACGTLSVRAVRGEARFGNECG